MSILSSVQFHMAETGQYGDIHQGWAEHEGKEVGSIEWYKNDGTVRNIEVKESHRRNGIATGLWNSAQDFAKKNKLQLPKHDSFDQTLEGNTWANKVGGEWSEKRRTER